jgi:Xaa-Pro dipeptidase
MSLIRYSHLSALIQSVNLDAVVLNPGPTLKYLTGLTFHLMERPTVLLIAPPAEPILILAELEILKARQAAFPVKTFTYTDNPATWQDSFDAAIKSLQLDGKSIGVEPNQLRFMELAYLQGAAPHSRFLSAEGILATLRMQKDVHEISAMRTAVQIAQQGLIATLPKIKTGVSEREVASELSYQLLVAGSDSEMPFSPIVSSGPNSANPHASPSDRKLIPGDLLVIDWGAAYKGYVSDLTRTFAIGEVSSEFKHITNVVFAANAAGRATSKPGIAAGDVDRAARIVIDKAGYGAQFFHRVGHGLGMEGHEPPYMFAENTLILKPGMTFTIEPGIYLANRGGVRIEDNMVITETGADTLSDLPRELIRLD